MPEKAEQQAPDEVQATPQAEGDAEKMSVSALTELLRNSRICEDSRRNASKYHKFWGTMPVPQMDEPPMTDVEASGPIEVKTVDDIRKEPYNLPESFEWHDCDVDDPNEMQEIYTLLSENYVEDDDNMFRFDYSADFLSWALKPPHFKRIWHVGVKVKKTKKLVGFITGIPATIVLHGKKVEMVEINFLCVYKKLRSKRLAPLLIKEITRRVNMMGIFQACYTAGVVLPKPIAECRYYHRSINPKKLIEVGFSHLGPRMTMARTVKLYKLPEATQLPGLRPMQEKDVPAVTKLLQAYLSQFKLHPHFEKDDVAHWLLPREGVIYSYVVETKGKVTDLCSFYNLPSSILGNEKHSNLKAAYSYWNVANTVSWEALMHDALICARDNEFDVFNALDVMDNNKFLKELKFGVGDGFLQYYLFNWKCPGMAPKEVGLVLL